MKTIKHQAEFCVIGGGLAGMCAAIQAARHGVKTVLMHERPVLGGNASSEIRMWVCGATGCLETGLVEEFRLENLYRNTYPNFSVWDSILYEKVKFQDNLTCILNCSCQDAAMDGNKIKSVTGWQMTTQTFHEVEAAYFADCSGDSILAPLTGAEFRLGREPRSEFNESLAHEQGDRQTMGMSCLLQARETDSPKKFIPPKWAKYYPDDTSFPAREHTFTKWQNFWWLELGGDQDSIGDTEEVRDELLKAAFGLWDHIKNHGDHGADNWVLDWVGFLPGKRESRRYVGDYIINENDVLSGGKFDDAIAYGGWPIDDHHPGGFRYFGPPNTHIQPKQPYGIPIRSIYSVNVDNLMFAGRNISASHTALSSSRVMATCAILGQAVGALVFFAARAKTTPREAAKTSIRDIQAMLMNDDCYLPGFKRPVSALCAAAKLSASSGDPEPLRSGTDRDIDGEINAWSGSVGDSVEYDFGGESSYREIRVVFDSDLKRAPHNMVANYFAEGAKYAPPETLVKAFHIEADGREIYRETNNYQRFILLDLPGKASKLRLVIDGVYGEGAKKVFSFEAK